MLKVQVDLTNTKTNIMKTLIMAIVTSGVTLGNSLPPCPYDTYNSLPPIPETITTMNNL